MLQREAEQLQHQMEQLAQERPAERSAGGRPGTQGSQGSQGLAGFQRPGLAGFSRVAGAVQPPTRARGPRSRRRSRRSIVCGRRRTRCGARRPIRARRPTRVWPLSGSARRAACSAGCSRRKPPDRLGSMLEGGRSPDRRGKEQADRVKQAEGAAATATPAGPRRTSSSWPTIDSAWPTTCRTSSRTCATPRASSMPASAQHPANFEQRSRAWTRPTSKRGCSAPPTGFARGIDPNGNGTEAQIASGLQRLSDQMHQAQQALVAGGQQQTGPNSAEAALNNVERLRRQIEALSGQNAGPGQQRSESEPGSRELPDRVAQSQRPARPARRTRRAGRTGQTGRAGRQGRRPGKAARRAQGGRGGDDIGRVARGKRADAGPERLRQPRHRQQRAARAAREARRPADAGRRSSAGDSTGVERAEPASPRASNDPEMQRQIQELITAMEHLDLRRFPGNPAMVEELHQRLLSGVDTLELQLAPQSGRQAPGQIRSTDPLAVPPGTRTPSPTTSAVSAPPEAEAATSREINSPQSLYPSRACRLLRPDRFAISPASPAWTRHVQMVRGRNPVERHRNLGLLPAASTSAERDDCPTP